MKSTNIILKTELTDYIDLNYSNECIKNILFDEINFNSNDKYITETDLYDLFSNLINYELLDSDIICDIIEFIQDKSIYDLDQINYKINMNYRNITSNNHIAIGNKYGSDELLDSEVRHYLFESDLYESCLYIIYESYDLFNINIDYDYIINSWYISELTLIRMYNESYNTNIKYVNDNDNYYIEISLNDILEMNKIILESGNKTNCIFDLISLNKFYNDSIDELFNNTNNSIDADEFFYTYLELYDEILFNELYDEYYYEIYQYGIYLSKIKFESIFDLLKYVLNIFKHYNLNNSFEFNESLYDMW